jgi:endonuclease YncB( thermonuclease family)
MIECSFTDKFTSMHFLLIALLASSPAFADVFVNSPRVIDGDTIETDIRPLPSLSPLKLRIQGIDTPEMKGKCQKEKDLARKAKDEVIKMTNGKFVQIVASSWDKYGGRVVGSAFVDGTSVAEMLVKQGLAVPYHGEKKTHDWCK